MTEDQQKHLDEISQELKRALTPFVTAPNTPEVLGEMKSKIGAVLCKLLNDARATPHVTLERMECLGDTMSFVIRGPREVIAALRAVEHTTRVPDVESAQRVADLLTKIPEMIDDSRADTNLEDYACPECGARDDLEVRSNKWVVLFENGTDDSDTNGDTEYDDTSDCNCGSCGHSGLLRDFTFPGLDVAIEALQDEREENKDEQSENT